MNANGQTRRKPREMPDGSPLAGLIVDADGISMTPAMAYGRLGRKYRYYVSQPLQVGRANALDRDVVRRVAAGAIEGLVMGKLTETSLLADDGWEAARNLILKVQLGRAEIVISVRKGELGPSGVASVRERLPQGHKLVEVGGKSPRLDLVIPGRPVFRGGRTWMASADGAPVAVRPKADPVLFKALKRAHQIIAEHHISPTTERHEYRLARGVDDSYLRSIAGLAFLAPDIQAAIVEGRQPAGLNLESLQQITLPLTWAEQRAALGFPA